MRTRSLLHAVTAAVAFLVAPAAKGHDFWLQLSSYRPAPGEVVKAGLRIGDTVPGEAFPRSSARIEKFAVFGPEGEQPVLGREGQDPAGLVRFTGPGLCSVAYASRPSFVELPAEKFEAYLREKALHKVLAQREQNGQTSTPGREMFSRCAKALIKVGEAPTGFDRTAGLRLEIIPESDPFAVTPGAALPVRVLLDGRACSGLTITAMPGRADATERTAVVTDSEGRASIPLATAGLWILNAVEMVPPPEGETRADWHSLWASLTFEIPEAAPSPR